jgi:YVTN family beta-propeller protein
VPLSSSGAPNSTPITSRVVGVVGTLPVGLFPTFMTEDLANGWVYVANEGSGTVTVLSGTTVVANVSVGGDDTGITYDPIDETVYVTDTSSDEVSVINGTTVVATIAVGESPVSPAFDVQDGFVYVPDSGSGTVSILNNTTLVATTPVGTDPVDATYDPVNGTVYVTNEQSDFENILAGNTTVAVAPTRLIAPFSTVYDPVNEFLYVTNYTPNGGIESDVTVINGTNDLATFPVGPGPGFAGCDLVTGTIYLPSSGADDVQLIQNTSLVGVVGVGGDPDAATFDPSDGLVYVSDVLTRDVVVINGSTPVADVVVGANPSIVAYDPSSGYVYVSVRGSEQVAALGFVTGWSVNFTGSGLPADSRWSVTIKQVALKTTADSVVVYEPNGSYGFVIGPPDGYAANPVNGSFVIDGNPVEFLIDFTHIQYPPALGLFGLPNPDGAVLIGLGIAVVVGLVAWQLYLRRVRRREQVLRA